MEIAFDLFPGGVRRALTMSFDDGKDFDLRLADIFDNYGIRGTFHLNSGNLDKPTYLKTEEVGKLSINHEISVHGKTHPFLDKIPLAFALQEVMEDKKCLESLSGLPVRGMSYPYGTFNDELIPVLKAAGMEYSRTVQNTGSFYLPDNFMKWDPTCHQSQELEKLWDKFMKFNKHIRLFYIWGHSYEFERDNSWQRIEAFCRMAGNHDEIWYATNIQLKEYITTMRSLIFTADKTIVYNPSAMEVWLTADGEVFSIKAGETKRLLKG